MESGTLHELLGPSKPRTTFSPSEMRQPARTSGQGLPPMMGAHERAAVIAPIASGNTLAVATGTSGTANGAGAKGLSSAPCVLCGVRKPQEEIALYVAGEAFCVPCDRLRRRANNLGMACASLPYTCTLRMMVNFPVHDHSIGCSTLSE